MTLMRCEIKHCGHNKGAERDGEEEYIFAFFKTVYFRSFVSLVLTSYNEPNLFRLLLPEPQEASTRRSQEEKKTKEVHTIYFMRNFIS